MKKHLYMILLACICLTSNAMQFNKEKDFLEAYSAIVQFRALSPLNEIEQNQINILHNTLQYFSISEFKKCEAACDTLRILHNKQQLHDSSLDETIRYILGSIITKIHEKFHRTKSNIDMSPFGSIDAFCCNGSTGTIAKNPFSFGQATLLSNQKLITANHVFDDFDDFRSLPEECIPSDHYEYNNLSTVFFFYNPNTNQYQKIDVFYKIDGADIAVAELQNPINHIVQFASLSNEKPVSQNLFIRYFDRMDLIMYDVTELIIKDFSDVKQIIPTLQQATKHANHLFIKTPFLKAGISGGGICSTTDNIKIFGIFCGVIDTTDHLPLFYFCPISPYYDIITKWLNNTQEEINE